MKFGGERRFETSPRAKGKRVIPGSAEGLLDIFSAMFSCMDVGIRSAEGCI